MKFFKLSGAGNDFIALVEPATDPSRAEIAAWCRRGDSIGADGLLVLERIGAGEASMRYWNSDGTRADLCLNGTRCAARLAFHLGWAADRVTIATDTGPVAAEAVDIDVVRVVAPPPEASTQRLALDLEDTTWDCHFLHVGVPHLVVPVADLAALRLAILGKALREHPRFAPEGTNVMFVRYASRESFLVRSYERGVEAETRACGTGTLAATAVGLALNLLDLPVAATTGGGFVLEIDGTWHKGGIESWALAGDARLVASGTILPGAVGGSTAVRAT